MSTSTPPASGSHNSSVYRFRLFVAGHEGNSERARAAILRLAERHLPGQHEIVVVDIMEDYAAALEHGIIVVPTLLVDGPVTRVIVGSLRDEAAVLAALGLAARDERPG